jgi:hypothetical protein
MLSFLQCLNMMRRPLKNEILRGKGVRWRGRAECVRICMRSLWAT